MLGERILLNNYYIDHKYDYVYKIPFTKHMWGEKIEFKLNNVIDIEMALFILHNLGEFYIYLK